MNENEEREDSFEGKWYEYPLMRNALVITAEEFRFPHVGRGLLVRIEDRKSLSVWVPSFRHPAA
jgi:hypothetical protein